jgi:predicted RNA-binding protein YlqC (UPF0109 family)
MKPTEPDQKVIPEVESIVSDLIRAVVRNPDGVKISSLVKGPLVAFVIKVDPDDVRRVIGKQGKHFKAMEVIIAEALRRIGRESHLVVDEKSPPVAPTSQKAFALGEYSSKKFKTVKELLKRLVGLYAADPEKVSVSTTDVGLTTLVEVKVRAEDYPAVYGRDANFEYGPDGHLIGAIKNFFDGVGKNNGRIIRIVLSRT